MLFSCAPPLPDPAALLPSLPETARIANAAVPIEPPKAPAPAFRFASTDTLAQARRYYNAVVRDFNTKTQTFPSVVIAKSFGFIQREFFEIEEAAKAVPTVDFNS